METGHAPLVNTAAYLAKSVIYNNRERFSASLIVSGWDKLKGGQVSFRDCYFYFEVLN
jgi:20S proteasome alpha/beta subunit